MKDAARKEEISMAQAIYSFYVRSRKLLAFVLVILVVVFRFIPVSFIQFSALTALGFLVLQILFELYEKVIPTETGIRHYPNIQAAFSRMTSVINNSLKKGKGTQISVMGLTLYHMWEYLKNYLNRADVRDMSVYLCMIDSSVPQIRNLPSNWAEISDGFYQAILGYMASHNEGLSNRDIQIQIDRYKHIPIIHGVLVNNEHLFFSFTSWNEKDEMEGATTFYAYYNSETRAGRDYIRLFENWLEHIKKRKCDQICLKATVANG